MLDKIKKIFDPGQKIVKQGWKKVPEIRENIERYQEKSDAELLRIIEKYRQELKEIDERLGHDVIDTIRMRKKEEGLPAEELAMFDRLNEIMPSVYAV
ncbi:MAG: hypothetical protein ACOCXP_01585, partial [Candidatus Dojkabacteria bacterium]